MITDEITTKLFSLQDTAYRDFQVKLIPGMDAQKEIGVRTPELRKLAKELAKREDIREFLNDLPHQYFDENQLHAFISFPMWTTGRPVTRRHRRYSGSTGRSFWMQ